MRVLEGETTGFARVTGCEANLFPFKYLGVPIGLNMARIKSWYPIFDKFKSKLSTWKAKMLSIGGQHSLIRVVLGSLGIYYLFLFKMRVKFGALLESARVAFFREPILMRKKSF